MMFRLCEIFSIYSKARSLTFFNSFKFSTEFDAKINYYKILGIAKSASEEQIKGAFLNKAKEYHPDINPENGQKFKLINEAYKVLSNQKTKLQYERLYEELQTQQQSSSNSSSVAEQLKQKNPFEQLLQVNKKYIKVKGKQKLNRHINPEYIKKQMKESEQNEERKQINKTKVVLLISGVLTGVMLLEAGIKYMKYKKQGKI